MEYVVIQSSRGEPFFVEPATNLRFNCRSSDENIGVNFNDRRGSCIVEPHAGGHIWVFETLSQALAHVEARREADRKPAET